MDLNEILTKKTRLELTLIEVLQKEFNLLKSEIGCSVCGMKVRFKEHETLDDCKYLISELDLMLMNDTNEFIIATKHALDD